MSFWSMMVSHRLETLKCHRDSGRCSGSKVVWAINAQ